MGFQLNFRLLLCPKTFGILCRPITLYRQFMDFCQMEYFYVLSKTYYGATKVRSHELGNNKLFPQTEIEICMTKCEQAMGPNDIRMW